MEIRNASAIQPSTFQNLVTSSWLLAILSGIAGSALTKDLPSALSSYTIDAKLDAAISAGNLGLILGGSLAFVATVASYIGIYRWRRWGRTLFAVMTVSGIACSLALGLLGGPAVEPGLTATLDGTINLLCGLVLACMYGVPSISERFR